MTAGPRASGPSPTAPEERIVLLDALRGFALLGVLLVNVQYFVEPRWGPLLAQTGSGPADRVALWLVDLFGTSKFYPLFSFLFGYGAAQQLVGSAGRAPHPTGFFAWRMTILLLIGAWHGALLWSGDILATYAMLGFVILLFRRASDRALVIWVVACSFAFSLALAGLRAGLDLGLVGSRAAEEIQAQFAASAEPWRRVGRQTLRIFAMFLLGFAAGRRAIFSDRPSEEVAARVRKIAAWCLPLGLAGSVGWVALGELSDPTALTWAWVFSVALLAASGPILAAGYTALFWQLFGTEAWRPRLARLAPVGRMALTNYILQSVVCLGLVGEHGLLQPLGPFRPPFGLFLTFTVFALQIVWSNWWLGRFRFGPLEWLWRSASYARLQPLR